MIDLQVITEDMQNTDNHSTSSSAVEATSDADASTDL